MSPDRVSWDVSDTTISSADICLDGTVTLNHEPTGTDTVDLIVEFPEIPIPALLRLTMPIGSPHRSFPSRGPSQ